jgi:hypothetical protein
MDMSNEMQTDDMVLGKDTIDRIVEKRRPCLIRFKSMQEIINKHAAWFDGYGNLHVSGQRWNSGNDSLAPSYFHMLGKDVELLTHHSFPDWCIEHQWQDLFEPNMALRAIASGKLEPERAVEIAKKAVSEIK